MIHPLVIWPDARLAQTCAPVTSFDSALEALAEDLLETMYDAPGRGLAAPQIGVLQRIFVMDPGWKDGASEPLVCVNPDIVDQSADQVTSHEGCLSIPGLSVEVTRSEEITLRWWDLDGAMHQARLSGFAALCAQHELDHLDGTVTLDRVTPEARAAYIASYSGGAA